MSRSPRPLAEQVVVITGASSGIGLATARHIAARGARVVVTARNADALEWLAREIEAGGGEALAVPADVTSEDGLREVRERAVERFGRIDTWINNAAVFIQGDVEHIELDEFRRVIDVNLLGYINGTKQALVQMKRQGYGGIIMISSILGDRAAAFFSAYAASKAGIDGFSESLRVELWQDEIHVSTLYLPPVDTPIYQHARGKFGTIPKPPPLIVDPDGVAKKIARLTEKPKIATSYGEMGILFWMFAVMPHHLADYLFHRMSEFTRTEIPDRGDNLDAPLTNGRPRVRGGWMEWGWRGVKPSEVIRILPWETAFGAGVAGLLAVGAARRLRRGS
jgi:NAD(P)-dependent dehydrogenase (short-subunit alcohol dehydrogenase family)